MSLQVSFPPKQHALPTFTPSVPLTPSIHSSITTSPKHPTYSILPNRTTRHPQTSRQWRKQPQEDSHQHRHQQPRMDHPNTGIYNPQTNPSNIHVIVFGATGYIGRYVVFEMARLGYKVTAYARERSGVGGKKKKADVVQDFGDDVRVVFGELDDVEMVKRAIVGGGEEVEDEGGGVESRVVVSCLASRSGGIADSRRVDYELSKGVLDVAVEECGVKHFVLLSAICVQKPLLAFQREKLRLERELVRLGEENEGFSYVVVRPTAFFKSLGAQVDRVKNGKAYVMFGNGDLARCNALSEADLARFIGECVQDVGKRNRILPVGGPGDAVTPKEQAELLFDVVGKKKKYFSLPIGIMDLVIGALDGIGNIVPAAKEAAEFGRIGKYYATEDMVGPSYGRDTLRSFFENVAEKGMEGQELGDAAVF